MVPQGSRKALIWKGQAANSGLSREKTKTEERALQGNRCGIRLRKKFSRIRQVERGRRSEHHCSGRESSFLSLGRWQGCRPLLRLSE